MVDSVAIGVTHRHGPIWVGFRSEGVGRGEEMLQIRLVGTWTGQDRTCWADVMKCFDLQYTGIPGHSDRFATTAPTGSSANFPGSGIPSFPGCLVVIV